MHNAFERRSTNHIHKHTHKFNLSNDRLITIMPTEKPAMTEFCMETAARASVLTCPARTCVTAPSEY